MTFSRATIPLLLLLATPAAAAPQSFDHGFQIGVAPLGVQVNNDSTAWYKTGVDFSGSLRPRGAVNVWLGGAFAYAVHGGPTHDISPFFFVMLTFERLIKIPLVPSVWMGVGSDMFFGDHFLGASAALRVGGGVHYWVTRKVGLGVETHLSAGPVVLNTNPVVTDGYASWDFLFGARFAP